MILFDWFTFFRESIDTITIIVLLLKLKARDKIWILNDTIMVQICILLPTNRQFLYLEMWEQAAFCLELSDCKQFCFSFHSLGYNSALESLT